ncbi:MAG: hypothetical protein AAGA54_19535 [Myxococcota bacterium]
MDAVINIVGQLFGALFDGMMVPLQALSLGWSLAIISTLLGAVMLVVFKYTGDPELLFTSIKRMQAYMMEMRLFDREPKLVFKAMGKLFWWNFKSILSLLGPMLWVTVPMVLLFFQMEHYYGMRPVEPGDSAVVTAKFMNEDAMVGPISLEGTDGAEVETAPVIAKRRAMASWRVKGLEPGEHTLTLHVGDESYTKTFTVGTERTRVSKRRAYLGPDALVYPIEPRLESGPVDWIDVRYELTETTFLGTQMHWLLWLVILSLVGALLVRWAVNAWRPNTL